MKCQLTLDEYKHVVSLPYEYGCVLFDVLIDRKPEDKEDICKDCERSNE